MTTAVATARLTAEEFEERFADVPFCELERGEVVKLTTGGWRHSRTVVRICFVLESWASGTSRGRTLAGEAGLVTERDPDTVRGADVAYFSYERVPKQVELPTSFSVVAPELAVEVVGKGQGWNKMVEKAGEYLAMGVNRVWVVDSRAKTVHAFSRDCAPVVFAAEDELRDDEILPGFACRVADFFTD